MSNQDVFDHITDSFQRGKLTTDEANVELVRAERYRLITRRLPRNIRRALNLAVREGKLGHLKKEGLKPEAYYHPEFHHMAAAARNQREREAIRQMSRVFVGRVLDEEQEERGSS